MFLYGIILFYFFIFYQWTFPCIQIQLQLNNYRTIVYNLRKALGQLELISTSEAKKKNSIQDNFKMYRKYTCR